MKEKQYVIMDFSKNQKEILKKEMDQVQKACEALEPDPTKVEALTKQVNKLKEGELYTGNPEGKITMTDSELDTLIRFLSINKSYSIIWMNLAINQFYKDCNENGVMNPTTPEEFAKYSECVKKLINKLRELKKL